LLFGGGHVDGTLVVDDHQLQEHAIERGPGRRQELLHLLLAHHSGPATAVRAVITGRAGRR
jgi:hypothetical protein